MAIAPNTHLGPYEILISYGPRSLRSVRAAAECFPSGRTTANASCTGRLGTGSRLPFGNPWMEPATKKCCCRVRKIAYWSPGTGPRDEKRLLIQVMFQKNDGTVQSDLWSLTMDEERKLEPFLAEAAWECCFSLSQDGRWIAYTSDRSGGFEVYVQGFPELGERWQISKGGGADPRWSRDGKELFYFNGSKFMSVEVSTQAKFDHKAPRLLFDWGFADREGGEYDVSPDGKRFLMLQRSDAERPATQINVVINWMEELKRRVPAGQ